MEYKQIAFGKVVSDVDFIKDFAAGLINLFGDRPNSYEGELMDAHEKAIQGLQGRVAALEADAVIGADIDYEVLGISNSMLMATASGAAIIVE